MKLRLAEAEKTLENIELVVGESTSAEKTATLLQEAGPKAPVLAINVQCFTLTRFAQPIVRDFRGMQPLIPHATPCGPLIARRRCIWTVRRARRPRTCCVGTPKSEGAAACRKSSTALAKPLHA